MGAGRSSGSRRCCTAQFPCVVMTVGSAAAFPQLETLRSGGWQRRRWRRQWWREISAGVSTNLHRQNQNGVLWQGEEVADDCSAVYIHSVKSVLVVGPLYPLHGDYPRIDGLFHSAALAQTLGPVGHC